jgi:hypothetical protein
MTPRLLLISAIVGFAFAAWSYFEVPSDRDQVFGTLRQQIHSAANTHMISDEGREFLVTKETEAAQAAGQRIQQADFSYGISFVGLLIVSCMSLAAYQQLSRRRA